MSSEVDRLDSEIINLLERDAWQSSEKLAEQLSVSSSTVRRRLKRMRQNHAVRAVVIPRPGKTAVGLTALIALNVELRSVDAAMEVLASLSDVRWVAKTTGRFDLVALTRFHSTSELSKFAGEQLTKVDGIKESETFVFLDLRRGSRFLD